MRQLILDYLGEAKMMQLATVHDGKPWVCNVWFVSDKNMNTYWISSSNRRHSKEIATNPYVAASICIPREPSEGKKGALQIEGLAREVTKPSEVAKALKLYITQGFFSLSQVKRFMADAHNPHKFFVLEPQRIVHFGNSAQEHILKK